MSKPKIAVILLLVLALVAPLFMPWLKTPLILATCFGLSALGVSILVRAGLLSFGHAMFGCLAGYTVGFIGKTGAGIDTALLIVIGTIAGTLLGALVGSFVVRYRAIFFGMLNLALSMVLFSILGKFTQFTGGSDGMRVDRGRIFGMALERDGYETVLLVMIVLLAWVAGVLVQRYLESVPGQALSAIKTNETRLEYIGMSTWKVLWIGYVISAALCSFAGAVFAVTQGLVTPEMGYWVRSGELVFISILGGVGHPVGAFLGAGVFEFLKLFAAAWLTGAWQLVVGVVLVLMVFFAPEGLSGLLSLKARRKEA